MSKSSKTNKGKSPRNTASGVASRSTNSGSTGNQTIEIRGGQSWGKSITSHHVETRTQPSALEAFAQRLQDGADVNIPKRSSLREFLEKDARVKLPGGYYGPYSFDGREAMLQLVDTIDLILGSKTGEPLKDSQLDICGGAQWGKTILALNFGVYVTGQLFRNWGYYLPDDDLVEGIVDGKLRPDVIDQIEWFADIIQVGKALNKSGKTVNRKGAFLVTDGDRKAVGMIRGMNKIPTSFSNDVACEDEKDDIPPKNAKYLKGRMTASDLRFKISIGTQRVHGAGQNKQFEDGSQGVMLIGPVGAIIDPALIVSEAHERCRVVSEVPQGWINPEEHWPQICRCAITGTPRPDDPILTYEGDFKRNGETIATYDPTGIYYLAHPTTGEELNRHMVAWHHRRPERIRLRKWSFRISQLGIPAIDLIQIVSHWTEAVKDNDEMIVFCCDRLAIPKSTSQALTPKILDRARTLEPFDMGLTLKNGCHGVAGLDMGDRCWFLAREIESPLIKRIRRVEQISSGNVVKRAVQLFHTMKLSAMFIDARPLVNEARTISFILNGLQGATFPKIAEPEKAYIAFEGGLIWDGPNGKWKNLKCAVVEFSLKPGQGIRHKLGIHDEDGQTKFFPIIQCNRYEAIERAVNEFLTAEENIISVVNGKLRTEPIMRLPQQVPGSPSILETLNGHLLTGSKRAKEKDGTLGDFVDDCENHFLLSDAYSSLAEMECSRSIAAPFAFQSIPRGGVKGIGFINSRTKGLL